MLYGRWNGLSPYTEKFTLPLDTAWGYLLVVSLHGVSRSTSTGCISTLEIPKHDSPPLYSGQYSLDRFIYKIESTI